MSVSDRKKRLQLEELIQVMESMKKDLLTKLKLDNPASTQPLEDYAEKVQTNRNENQTKSTTDTKSVIRQNRDSRNI